VPTAGLPTLGEVDNAPERVERDATRGRSRPDRPDRVQGAGRAGPADRHPAAVLMDLGLLQARAGNAAVGRLLGGPAGRAGPLRSAQRIPISERNTAETVFNQTHDVDPAIPAGQAQAATFGGGEAKYDMTRTGGPPAGGAAGPPALEAVTVTVRMQFVSQRRDPVSGGYVGSPAAIPAGDERRQFGEDMCRTVAGNWTAQGLALDSTQHPAPPPAAAGSAPSPAPPAVGVHLPVTFRAVAVWDPADTTAHTTIRLFGRRTAADPTKAGGNPIDAGDYYMNQGTQFYQGMTLEAIYTHEYGHLIGLRDEYSMSNPQAHTLMHGMGGGGGPAADQAMDRETVRRMVLAALTPLLRRRLAALRPQLVAALGPGQRTLLTALQAAVSGAADEGALAVVALLAIQPVPARLEAAAVPAVAAALRRAKASASRLSGPAGRAFAPAAMAGTAISAYLTALDAAGQGSFGGMWITIQGSGEGRGTGVWGAAASGANATSAATFANRGIGLPRGRGRVPPVQPSTSLLAALDRLPAGWATAGGGAAAQMTPAAVAVAAGEALLAASAAGASTARTRSVSGLRATVSRLVLNAFAAAAQSTADQFVQDEVAARARDSVTALNAEVTTEVERVMGTPAGGVAALAPVDPAITNLATAMRDRLQAGVTAANTAQVAARTTPLNPGDTQPAQEVTYDTAHNIMSDNQGNVRLDQFAILANQFNAHEPDLKHRDEDPFHAVHT
jgi:hypothetical protein